MRLEELAEVRGGISSTKSDTGRGDGAKAFRVIQITHIQAGKIAPATALKVAYLKAAREPTRFAVKVGDILVAMLGDNPKVASVTAAPRRCLAGKEVALVRPCSKAAGKRILKYLTSKRGQDLLRSKRSGVTIQHMKLADLKAIAVP